MHGGASRRQVADCTEADALINDLGEGDILRIPPVTAALSDAFVSPSFAVD